MTTQRDILRQNEARASDPTQPLELRQASAQLAAVVRLDLLRAALRADVVEVTRG